MKCTYCAEEIKDDAIVCHYCGATKEGEHWNRNSQTATTSEKPKGHTTIRIAAALILISALLELTSIVSEVPLFGAMQTGLVAACYHLTFIGLFSITGLALWRAKSWAPRTVLITAVVCSADKIRYLLDMDARRAEIGPLLSQAGGIVDEEFIMQTVNLTIAFVILSWWGFAAYIYFRRSYFERPKSSGTASVEN